MNFCIGSALEIATVRMKLVHSMRWCVDFIYSFVVPIFSFHSIILMRINPSGSHTMDRFTDHTHYIEWSSMMLKKERKNSKQKRLNTHAHMTQFIHHPFEPLTELGANWIYVALAKSMKFSFWNQRRRRRRWNNNNNNIHTTFKRYGTQKIMQIKKAFMYGCTHIYVIRFRFHCIGAHAFTYTIVGTWRVFSYFIIFYSSFMKMQWLNIHHCDIIKYIRVTRTLCHDPMMLRLCDFYEFVL